MPTEDENVTFRGTDCEDTHRHSPTSEFHHLGHDASKKPAKTLLQRLDSH